jgi:hypothetical protein
MVAAASPTDSVSSPPTSTSVAEDHNSGGSNPFFGPLAPSQPSSQDAPVPALVTSGHRHYNVCPQLTAPLHHFSPALLLQEEWAVGMKGPHGRSDGG